MEVRKNSMPENGIRQSLNVFDRNVVTAVNESSRLRTEDQELGRTETGAVIDILLHEIRRVCAARPARARELHRITRNFFGHGHLPDEPLEFENFLPADRLFKLNLPKRGRLVHDLDFFILRQVINDDVEHEPVELGFGQRIRSFQFDGVLSGEHVERLLENIRVAFNRHRPFLHGLQQGRLRLGGSPVDFVRENDVCKDRTFDEHARALAGGAVFFDDFGSGNVGRHQVRRELNALEIEMKHLSYGCNQQRLCKTGNAGDDGVAAGQHRYHHLVDDVFLSDDDLPDFVIDFLKFYMKPLDYFEFFLLFNAEFHDYLTFNNNSRAGSYAGAISRAFMTLALAD